MYFLAFMPLVIGNVYVKPKVAVFAALRRASQVLGHWDSASTATRPRVILEQFRPPHQDPADLHRTVPVWSISRTDRISVCHVWVGDDAAFRARRYGSCERG